MTAEDREALVSQVAHYMRKWEAAEAECHRLRQMYQDALRTVASSNEACATERAAHEATKAELATAQQRKRLIAEQRDAAEQRVAELAALNVAVFRMQSQRDQAEAALEELQGVLSSSPEPATPAATGAEPCDHAVLLKDKCLTMSDPTPERIESQADEQQPPCCACGTVTAARGPCPFCLQVFCQACAEKPYEFCCDGESEPKDG